jgi:hypothetical protein
MRSAIVTLALCCVAAACGGDPAPIPDKRPSADPEEPVAPPEPESGAVTKPAEPLDTKAVPVPEPVVPPTPAPPARQTKDAKGHDWASHMGDIAFTFDSGEAATRSKKEGRVQMMYFTSPT